MKAPGIRRERRFFDREAVRYERDRKSPITLAGTVYSEDFGMLNDTDNEALRNIPRALYPGETAANANGQAHRFYMIRRMNIRWRCMIDFIGWIML